jgi:hypothetical protein
MLLLGVVAVAPLEEVDAVGVLVLVNVPCKSRVVPPHNSHAASLKADERMAAPKEP